MNSKAPKKWPRILFKLFLVLIVTLVIVLFVLSKIGGNNPALREGLEQFLSQATGGRAVIGELVHMGFVPNVKVDIQDLIIQKPGDPTTTWAQVDKILFSQPTWHYTFGRSTVEYIQVENFISEPGFWSKDEIILESLGIIDGPYSTPSLQIVGQAGAIPFKAGLEMQSEPYRDIRTLYKLGDVSLFSLTLGTMDLNADVIALKPGTRLSDMNITLNGKDFIKGNLEFDVHKVDPFLKADFKIGQSDVDVVITITPSEEKESVSIQVQSDKFYDADFKSLQALWRNMGFLPVERLSETHIVEGSILINQYYIDESPVEDVNVRILVDETGLKLEPVCDRDLTENKLCAQYKQ